MVRGARAEAPMMVLLDLLGRRWTMRMLWELRDTHLTFRALQAACGTVSATVLNDRLRDLREAALIELDDKLGYGLTELGRELVTQFVPLAAWSERWARTALD
jgi:DNA-binding HxlR family transcriptional regulator